MIWLYLILILIWVYLLRVLSKAKLDFFKFMLGSVGLFLFLMILVQPIATLPLAKAVTATTGIFGELTSMFKAYYQYTIIFIDQGKDAISLFVDYECAGIIEILAFVSLLWFFPLYSFVEKAVLSVLGVLWIFAANVIRLLVIITLVYFFGNDIFFFAHAIFGRIIFYGLAVIMYFNVFTRSQIIRQKIGKFSYGNDNKETN